MENRIDKPCKHCGVVFTRARRVEQYCSLACQFWFNANRGAASECWPWGGTINSGGYGIVSVNYKTLLAHRVSLELSMGEPLGDRLACHHCDNPPCVNPAHLFAGSQQDNVADKIAKGRARYRPSYVRGSASGMAKVTEADVLEMRRRADAGEGGASIGRDYPAVTTDAIYRIIKRKNWRHI